MDPILIAVILFGAVTLANLVACLWLAHRVLDLSSRLYEQHREIRTLQIAVMRADPTDEVRKAFLELHGPRTTH